VYVLLTEEGMDNLMWFCEGCKHALPGVKNLVRGVESVQESVKDLKKRVEVLEESIERRVSSAIDDFKDRESRKMNLIFH
jgi:hypothetical protein